MLNVAGITTGVESLTVTVNTGLLSVPKSNVSAFVPTANVDK